MVPRSLDTAGPCAPRRGDMGFRGHAGACARATLPPRSARPGPPPGSALPPDRRRRAWTLQPGRCLGSLRPARRDRSSERAVRRPRGPPASVRSGTGLRDATEALAGRDADLGDLLPPSEVEELLERCAEASSPVQRIRVAAAWLRRRIRSGRPLPGPIEASVTELRRSGGRTQVKALADAGPWSRTRFSVRFREEVGVPPRTVARILRFHRTLKAMGSAASVGSRVAAGYGRSRGFGSLFSRLAHECGFADQAHFTREFRRFADMTPSEWLERARFPDTTTTAEPG
jgi:AraC-like DNA-binding protein